MGLQGPLQAGISFTANLRPLLPIPQRSPSNVELLRSFGDQLKQDMRVSLPAKVVSWNAETQTITAQPLIREKQINQETGEVEFITLPEFPDIPVSWPMYGNFALTMAPKAGDEVMLLFSDLSIESWKTMGDVQNWVDRRRHDMSDAVAACPIRSRPNLIENVNEEAAELRTIDGSVKVAVSDDSIYLSVDDEGTNILIEPDNIEILAQTVTMETESFSVSADNFAVNATSIALNGVLTINGFAYLAHKHAGVETGPGVSGGVVP